jgi:hypothetical protein
VLTYKSILLFLFLAAFAEEEVAVLRWLLARATEIGTEPALQGLGYSALSLAVDAAVIYAVVWLACRWWRSRHRPEQSSRTEPDSVSDRGRSKR